MGHFLRKHGRGNDFLFISLSRPWTVNLDFAAMKMVDTSFTDRRFAIGDVDKGFGVLKNFYIITLLILRF